MEEFVPFDIAITLNEIGFKEKCLAYYDVLDNVGLLYNTYYADDISPCQYTELLLSHNSGDGRQADDSEYCVDAPTISQVVNWLLTEKDIFINIDCSCSETFKCFYTIYKKGEDTFEIVGFNEELYDTIKEATLAGIKHVLNKLI